MPWIYDKQMWREMNVEIKYGDCMVRIWSVGNWWLRYRFEIVLDWHWCSVAPNKHFAGQMFASYKDARSLGKQSCGNWMTYENVKIQMNYDQLKRAISLERFKSKIILTDNDWQMCWWRDGMTIKESVLDSHNGVLRTVKAMREGFILWNGRKGSLLRDDGTSRLGVDKSLEMNNMEEFGKALG